MVTTGSVMEVSSKADSWAQISTLLGCQTCGVVATYVCFGGFTWSANVFNQLMWFKVRKGKENESSAGAFS
mgnify:CR=1 FL=1